MTRVIAAGLLALPALLLSAPSAAAQGPGCPIPPAGMSVPQWGSSHLGCGGFCFNLFPKLHFHGPLFNYGPYTGYYPFEPYGPWNAQLQYTGPRGGNCADGGCGRCGGCLSKLRAGHGLGWDRGGCGGCGQCGSCKAWGGYAKATLGNVFHRTHPLSHKCKAPACGDVAAAETPADGAVVAKEAAEAPTVEQTGYPRRER